MHEAEKWKWSRSVVSDSSRPHGLQPTRLLCPWDSAGKSTGVGCHCLLRLTVWMTTNFGKFFKKWEYQTTWPAPWEICVQVKKQQLELDMEQQTGSRSGKEYVKAVCFHPAYLTYIQNTSYKMPGWMKHELESRLPGEISINSNTQITLPLWQKVKKN